MNKKIKDNKIKILENNKLKEYDIYKASHSDKVNKNYIIYTDGDNYYAASYTIENEHLSLQGIDDDKEWDYIDEVLNNE